MAPAGAFEVEFNKKFKYLIPLKYICVLNYILRQEVLKSSCCKKLESSVWEQSIFLGFWHSAFVSINNPPE